MSSCMFETKPLTCIATLEPHSCVSRSSLSRALRPHTTIIWNRGVACPPRKAALAARGASAPSPGAGAVASLEPLCFSSSLAVRITIRRSPPTPSPPPTMSTVGSRGTSPSSARSSSFTLVTLACAAAAAGETTTSAVGSSAVGAAREAAARLGDATNGSTPPVDAVSPANAERIGNPWRLMTAGATPLRRATSWTCSACIERGRADGARARA